MSDNHNNIHETYTILMDILLCAEGNKNINCHNTPYQVYEQKKQIQIAPVFVPLLYAASNSVQMAVAFLPYYLKQYLSDNQSDITDLKEKIMSDTIWFTQDIYPNLLKFLLADSLRTVATTDLNASLPVCNNQTDSLFLYDSECTLYPPYYGINIHDLGFLNIHDSQQTLYLVGDISVNGMNILVNQKISGVIYGVTPDSSQNDSQGHNWLHRRLDFFSKTILAGSLNMQLPFIEHYFQAGIAPFSFYHLLYRTKYPNIMLKNALCLLHSKQPKLKLQDYISYKRVIPHTDLHILPNEMMQSGKIVNYLTLLSLIP